MPYKIDAKDNKFQVVNSDTGKVMGEHASRAKAEAQMRALYANEPEASKRSKMDKLKVNEIHQHAAHIMAHTASMLEEPETAEEAANETPEDEAAGKSLNLSYAKSIRPDIQLPDMAVKYVALNQIRHPVFLWGEPKITDLEGEYFTRDTDFWDKILGKSVRPLTWDHAQDALFDADPVIGKTIEWEDDEIGRWAISQLETNHKYRKAIDKLISEKRLGSAAIAMPVVGSSSDTAPQYVKRVSVGKSVWLARWPWFATALTPSPCEPRMIDSNKGVDFYKSLGVLLPDTSVSAAWEWNRQRMSLLKTKIK